TRTPRGCPFNPEREDLTEAAHPAGQVAAAARRGRERRGVEQAAELVEHDHDMKVLMGIDTSDDARVVVCDRWHCRPLSVAGGWHARPGGWTRQGAGLLAQAPLRSRSPDRLCHNMRPAPLGRQ